MCTVSSATSEEGSSSTAWTCHRGINTRNEALRRVVFKRKATSITEHKHSLYFAEWLCDSGWVPSKHFQVSSPEEGMLLPLCNDGIDLKKILPNAGFFKTREWRVWCLHLEFVDFFDEHPPARVWALPGDSGSRDTPKPLGPTNDIFNWKRSQFFFFLKLQYLLAL